MNLDQALRCIPDRLESEYTTKQGTPGVRFKYKVEDYYVTVTVTGANERDLPIEVASSLAAWSLRVLVGKAS